jgi:zinc transporter ZupT
MDLLATSEELRQIIVRHLEDEEVLTYLHERQGLSREEAAAWRDRALTSLESGGHYDPPREAEVVSDDLVALLKGEHRLGFFSGLSDDTLQRVAARLIQKRNPPGHNYFHLGHPADRVYLLRRGTVYLFDPDDRSRKPVVVEAGEPFGGLSFLTEGTHAVTAVGRDQTEVSVLRRWDFAGLLEEIPELRHALSTFLRRHRVVEYLEVQHHIDARRAASWTRKAARSVEGGSIFPSLAEMTRAVAGHQGAAMAMFLGILLDGVPESFVIGANVLVTGGISLSLLGGLFLANLPEALSSAAGMKEQGMPVVRILWMWTSLMLMTGLGAALGATVLDGAQDVVFALIEGVAAGAMLTVVAETMLPEAFHKGGGIVGISTLAGFLMAVFLNTLA